MQGVVYEYPVEHFEKVLKALDSREGFKENEDRANSSFLRSIMRAYSDKVPYGALCLVYISNEEHKNYTGEWNYQELLKELAKDYEDDAMVKYLRLLRNALINETCDDAYITKIREDLVKYHNIRV